MQNIIALNVFDFYKVLHIANNWPNRSKCIFYVFQRTRHRVLWYTIRWTTCTIKRPIAVTSFYAVKWLALVLVPTIIHHLAFVCEYVGIQKWTPCVRILYGGDFLFSESRLSYFKYWWRECLKTAKKHNRTILNVHTNISRIQWSSKQYIAK